MGKTKIMKKLYFLNEEESNRILNLHKDATKRQYLNVLTEQEQFYKGSDGKVGKLVGPYNLPQGATRITQQEYDTQIKTQTPNPNTYHQFQGLEVTPKTKVQTPTPEQLKKTTTRTPNKYEKCVPLVFVPVISHLLSQGYDKQFLKTSLGVIGRESDFGDSTRYQMTAALKSLWAYVGGQTSVGFGQIKPDTANKYGLKISDLNSADGSLRGVYKILKNNYNIAINNGYSNNKPTSNFTQGTGSAALDMAIIAFNLGESKNTKYCKTNDPNIKRPCSMSGKTIQEQITVTKEWVPNYLPNFKSQRWDGVDISSHGYVKEVAQRIKGFTCF